MQDLVAKKASLIAPKGQEQVIEENIRFFLREQKKGNFTKSQISYELSEGYDFSEEEISTLI